MSQTIEDIKQIPSAEAYVQRIKDFAAHVSKTIPEDANGTEEQRAAYDTKMLALYDLKWTVSFGGETLTINNEAHIHMSFIYLLEDYIENCL